MTGKNGEKCLKEFMQKFQGNISGEISEQILEKIPRGILGENPEGIFEKI